MPPPMPPEFVERIVAQFPKCGDAFPSQVLSIALSCLPTQPPIEMLREYLDAFFAEFGIANDQTRRTWALVRRFFTTPTPPIHLTPDTITQHSGGLETAREIDEAAFRAGLACNVSLSAMEHIGGVRRNVEARWPQPTKVVLNIVELGPWGMYVRFEAEQFHVSARPHGEAQVRYSDAATVASVWCKGEADDWYPRIFALKSAPTIVVPVSDPRPAVGL